FDPATIEDVIFGCANQQGEQGFNIARMIGLLAGLPIEVAGTTVDRQCGSSLQAVNFGTYSIATGNADVVIAGGVEHMGHIPRRAAPPTATRGHVATRRSRSSRRSSHPSRRVGR